MCVVRPCAAVSGFDVACYKPITSWYSKYVNPSGRRSLVFDAKAALQPDDPLEISCGQCVGCLLKRSADWAVRCHHESTQYDSNLFITLTFDERFLKRRADPWSVNKRDFQLFIKKYRRRFGAGIKYLHCGEYGEVVGRPHYHAILFNTDLPDKELWFKTPQGHTVYRSSILERIWGHGMCPIGSVTFASAGYVARYCLKKLNGIKADEIGVNGLKKYEVLDEFTGEVVKLEKEYSTMSNRPAIGSFFAENYLDDVYPHDYLTIDGKKYSPPKYYDAKLEKFRPELYERVKEARVDRARMRSDDSSYERLLVRERCKMIALERLIRPYDKGL